jgi:uncharacterized protein
MRIQTKLRKNITLGIGIGLTLILVLLAWLNTTAMTVIVSITGFGVVIALLALLSVGIGIYSSIMQAGRYHTSQFGLVSMAIVIVLGGWFIYDGILSFNTEEVQFKNGEITLTGTLYLPPGGCPCPAAILIHGSGRQTRDEYRYYARKLAQKGIIGLVYDKRGTGSSDGDLYTVGYKAYAEDAAAGIRFLEQRADVNKYEIGVIGYSEGEWVAPLAYLATGGKPVFIVVVGPSGLSPAGQVNEEIKIRLRSLGFGADAVQNAVLLNNMVFQFYRTGMNRDSVLTAIYRHGEDSWLTEAEDIPRGDDELGFFEDYKWWRMVMDTDPESLWVHVDTPVLFLKGERDSRSTADVAEQKLRAALEKGGNTNVEFVRFPKADHLILEWPFGEGVPPPLFAHGYLDTMTKWIHSVVGKESN